jgi:hypothetical protein
MTEHLDNPDREPTVFSLSLEEDGKLSLTRRDFLSMALVVGGALILAGCKSAQKMQATLTAPPTAQPSDTPAPQWPPIDLFADADESSPVIGTLQANYIVMLLSDRREQGWVKVFVPGGLVGWVRRSLVDFTRAVIKEPGSGEYFPIATDQQVESLIYLVLAVPGGPTPALPVTCPQYDGPSPWDIVTTPAPKFLPTFQPYSVPTFQPYSVPTLPCSCVSYIPCPCVSFRTCSCVGYNPCACVTHLPCTCVAYFPCTCVAFNPCSCLTFNACGCVAFNPCSCLAFNPCGCVAFNPCGCLAFNPCGCVAYMPCMTT